MTGGARAPAVERSDLDTLTARLASLEAATKGIGDQLARITNAAAAGNTRQAVLAIALNTAVERGAPYGRELAAIDPANADSATLAALRPFAETGVPSPCAAQLGDGDRRERQSRVRNRGVTRIVATSAARLATT